jgi:pyruvate dehydrogenase E2 component (dihydrolipoamide acetyltransferase)
MIEVRLPREGSTTMSAGVVLEWFVEEGDLVTEGQVVAEIETDKVSFEIAAPGSGTVRQRCAELGAEVEVGAVLLRIGTPDEPLPEADETALASRPQDAAAPAVAAGTSGPRNVASDQQGSDTPTGALRAVPAARRRARELGIGLAAVTGTGPLGRIGVGDVEAAAAGTTALRRGDVPSVGAPELDPLRGLTGHRAVVARRMTQASQETAAVTLMLRTDVTRIRRTDGVSLIDVVAHEAARCVMRHSELNGSLTGAGIVVHEHVGLGYAVDGAKGLIVPVVPDADVLSLVEFSTQRRRVVRAALEGTLVPGDLGGGTFTVSNLGGTGVEFFTPIITPGQTAVLGLGAAVPTVVPTLDGSGFGVRHLLGLSLTFDHRIVDGAEAGRYLQDLDQVLSSWEPGR